MKSEKKLEIPTQQTTARIPRDIHAAVLERKSTDVGLTEAINEGLLLWLAFQDADEEFVDQVREMVSGTAGAIRRKWERDREKTTKKSPRSVLAG